VLDLLHTVSLQVGVFMKKFLSKLNADRLMKSCEWLISFCCAVLFVIFAELHLLGYSNAFWFPFLFSAVAFFPPLQHKFLMKSMAMALVFIAT
jgi:hypothetical protein